MRFEIPISILFLTMALPTALGADFLVTRTGELIETREPWEIDGDTLSYTGLDGESHEIPLDDVDLEASEETTALRAGQDYVPSEAALAQRHEQERRANAGRVDEEDASIILYTRWHCGPCEEAEQYLGRLGASYRVKNEERKQTRRELRKKAGKKYILPVLDIDGEIVVGFRQEDIRRLVEELEEDVSTAAE